MLPHPSPLAHSPSNPLHVPSPMPISSPGPSVPVGHSPAGSFMGQTGTLPADINFIIDHHYWPPCHGRPPWLICSYDLIFSNYLLNYILVSFLCLVNISLKQKVQKPRYYWKVLRLRYEFYDISDALSPQTKNFRSDVRGRWWHII